MKLVVNFKSLHCLLILSMLTHTVHVYKNLNVKCQKCLHCIFKFRFLADIGFTFLFFCDCPNEYSAPSDMVLLKFMSN